MRIVQAKPEHLDAIRACAEAAYEKYVARIGKTPAPMVADFASQIAAGQVHVLIEDAAVLGFVVFYPRDDHIHLENVAVDPAHHGHGCGRMLIAFVEQQARRQGFEAIELYTNEKMTENLTFYPRLGYREIGRWAEDGFNRVFYRKALADHLH